MSALDQVGFVVDENLVALGRALRQLRRREFAVFGDDELAELIPKGALDSEWIPIAGDRGWVVITNDRRVRTRAVESALARASRVAGRSLAWTGRLSTAVVAGRAGTGSVEGGRAWAGEEADGSSVVVGAGNGGLGVGLPGFGRCVTGVR